MENTKPSMKIEDIKKLSKNPGFIQGISAYCDRWCEKCAYTDKCLTYALNNVNKEEGEEYFNLNTPKFWDKLKESYQLTLEILKETAKEEGIDIEEDNSDHSQNLESMKDEVSKHACCLEAKEYADLVDVWFDKYFGFDEDEYEDEEFVTEGSFFTAYQLNTAEVEILEETLDTIRWFQHQIYIKIMRAVSSQTSENSLFSNIYEKDSDGSAKVSLLGIDKSVHAWGKLLLQFPEHEDFILDILVKLVKMRNITEKEFPNARAFKRPGFDIPV